MTPPGRTCPTCHVASAIPEQFPTATVCTSCGVAAWAAREDLYAQNYYCGPDQPGTHRHVAGAGRVLFTAPSSVNYYRGDMRQPASKYTGSLATTLADLTGQDALTATSQARDLPVRDTPEGSFAEALAAHVTPESLVVDVRGMRDRSFDVSVGTGPAPDDRVRAVAREIERVCTARGLRVAVDSPFGALPPWTVAQYSQTRLGVPAIQVLLAFSLRNPAANPLQAQLTLTALRAAAAAALT